MLYKKIDIPFDVNTTVSEITLDNCLHLCISIIPNKYSDFTKQLTTVTHSLKHIYSLFNLKKEYSRFSRFFLSDIKNQIQELHQSEIFNDLIYLQSSSIIEQIPANISKIGIIATYKVNENCQIKIHENSIEFFENNYNHIWHCNIQSHIKESVFNQTLHVLEYYQSKLRKQNANMQNHCLRTWFYIRDIDNSYEQMVEARKEHFNCIGLTSKTHYIASTGIEGKNYKPNAYISLDGYAISNIFPEQIEYLQAKDFLNPTHEYGVTFERGTAIYFENHTHIIISGTASIDNTGTIVHEKSIEKQIEHTFKNIQALLLEAEAEMDSVQYFIIYLRDISDYIFVKNYIEHFYTNIPFIIVQGAVCRPGWLIEIECEAYKKNKFNQKTLDI